MGFVRRMEQVRRSETQLNGLGHRITSPLNTIVEILSAGSFRLVFWKKLFCASCNRAGEDLYFSTGAVSCFCEMCQRDDEGRPAVFYRPLAVDPRVAWLIYND